MEQVKMQARTTAGRLLKGAGVGLATALVALGAAGPIAAAGAFVGSVVAAAYGDSFLRSHEARLARSQTRVDARIARSALVRLVLVGLGTAGAYALGENVAKAYLLSLAATFSVLFIPQIFRTAKSLRVNRVGGTK